MKKILLCLAIAWVFTPMLFAQQKDYIPLESASPVPPEFMISASEKIETDISNRAGEGSDEFDRKAREQFFESSNLQINSLLKSGVVLFNDPVTRYINEVADELLKDDPKLRGEISIYVLKSPAVNAFATDYGGIFINLGLLPRLRSEAELAFILSHEIIHYRDEDGVEGYVKKQNLLDKNKKKIRKDPSAAYEAILTNCLYSKETEMKADLEGLEIFKKSAYFKSAPLATFKMLKNAQLPYEMLAFKEGALNNKLFEFPENYFSRDTLITYEIDSLEIAEMELMQMFSTHPAPDERHDIINEKLAGKSDGKKFILPESRFKKIQRMAEFELCKLFNEDVKYVDAFYQTLLLEQKYGMLPYIKRERAKALFGLAKYGNIRYPIMLGQQFDTLDWKGKNWYFALEELSAPGLTVLALAQCFEIKDDAKNEDKFLNKMIHELMRDMAHFYPKISDKAEPEEDSEEEEKDISPRKADKIAEDFVLAAWDKIKARSDFSDLYEKGKKEKRHLVSKENEKEYRIRVRKERRRKARLVNKKVIMLNPVVMDIDFRKKNDPKINYGKSENLKARTLDVVGLLAKRFRMQLSSLDQEDITDAGQDSLYNDLSTLNTWVSERRRHHPDLEMLSLSYDDVVGLRKRYDTPYLMRFGMINLHYKKNGFALRRIGEILSVAGIPYAIVKAVQADRAVIVFTEVLDMDTGEIKGSHEEVYKFEAKGVGLYSVLYEEMRHVK